jgi:preprotein translocase subunit SecY
MFASFIQKLKMIAQDAKLRNRVLFVLGALLIFRLLAAIPIPGVDRIALEEFFNGSQFLSFINIFSGGGLSGLSIVMLGVGPYITGSIIMQLLTMMSEKLKALYHEEGEAGRRKFAQYSRMLTVPLAAIQGYGFMLLLQQQGILENMTQFQMLSNLVIIIAGSILLMWIGELVSEFGIGNGMSLIIFAGIVAGLPNAVQQILVNYDASQISTYVLFVVMSLIITFAVVLITEAERPIPITYAKQARGSNNTTKTSTGPSTYLPLRLNQAGVIPIIFALSIMLLPQMLVNFLGGVQNEIVQSAISGLNQFINNGLAYGVAYFILVFLFTYFYTAVTFDPDSVAKNLQQSGAFIPGVRPGESTAKYVGNVISRVTLVGATFLGLIAILPIIAREISGIEAVALGGTSLLIAVSVVIDLIKKIDAQLSMREY